MTTISMPDTLCALTLRQQENRIVEVVALLTDHAAHAHAPFYAIQARTGIAVVDLGPLLDRLCVAGTLVTCDLGGYRLARVTP